MSALGSCISILRPSGAIWRSKRRRWSVSERYEHTHQLLSDNVDKLDKLAGLLLEHESLDADQIRAELGFAPAPAEAPPARLEAVGEPTPVA